MGMPQIYRCLCSFQKDISGTKINTDKLSVEEIVDFILKHSYIDINI